MKKLDTPYSRMWYRIVEKEKKAIQNLQKKRAENDYHYQRMILGNVAKARQKGETKMNGQVREIIIMTLSIAAITLVAIALELVFNHFGSFLMQGIGVFALARILTQFLLNGDERK